MEAIIQSTWLFSTETFGSVTPPLAHKKSFPLLRLFSASCHLHQFVHRRRRIIVLKKQGSSSNNNTKSHANKHFILFWQMKNYLILHYVAQTVLLFMRTVVCWPQGVKVSESLVLLIFIISFRCPDDDFLRSSAVGLEIQIVLTCQPTRYLFCSFLVNFLKDVIQKKQWDFVC